MFCRSVVRRWIATREPQRHTPLRSKIEQCMSAREIGALLENRASVVANSLSCTAAIKRLGELKTQKTASTVGEESYALQIIYRTAYKQDFAPREIARFLHKVALTRLDSELPKFALDKLNQVEDYQVFTHVELANLAWTFAKYKRRDDLWFERTQSALLEGELDTKLTPDDMSNLLWSFAILRYQPTEQLLDKCTRHSKVCTAFTLQAAINFVWALAKFNYAPAKVDHVFATIKHSQLKRLRIQSLANLLWAQAELGNTDVTLTEKIIDTYLHNFTAKDFSPMALENTVLGLNKVPRELGARLDEMLVEATKSVK
ncbi:hypothetical protein BASA81_005534 [Batrachochytrium salamandrivorans]|nr:hypothetical protein BASA81_005534 [Batrachochytrium salamandrivorans]